ncbi:proline-rich transmembrane protein 4-like [Penaeus vannamei]|uniref:proline-rich transmembrane protein 4-like n=1 Tax=Penaeus vannamei TaxID=6689 RepID=UPI00387F8636
MGGLKVLALLALAEWCAGAAVRSSGGSAPGRQLRLMTKSGGEADPPPRRGSSTMESEIAAIFRGVAYGAAAHGPNGTTLVAEAITPSTSAAAHTAAPTVQPRGSAAKDLAPSETPQGSDAAARGAAPASTQQSPPTGAGGGGAAGAATKSLGESMTALPDGPETRPPTGATSTAAPASAPGTVVSDAEAGAEGGRGAAGAGRDDPGPEWTPGGAWWPHVYVSAALFSLLALVALCLTARAAVATHLLPRPHYLSLHILVFFAAFLRSLHILHDAHDIKHLLPAALLVAVEETGWPCLTAALAVVVVAVLRAWRCPTRPHLAVLLAVLTAAHLIALPAAHLTAVLLEQDKLPIRMTTRAVTAAWGGTVGVGGLWAVWRESRDYSSQMPDVRAGQECQPSTTHPARLVLTATLTQLLLAGLHLYMLLAPASPAPSALHAWAWWCRFIVSRGLELIVGSTLVTAAALTLSRPPAHCCVFSTCCQKRTVEMVHPAEIKMIHPMGVYTLQPSRPKNEHAQTIAALSLSSAQKDKRDHASLDYVTSDFQLVWSHGRQRPLSAAQTAPRLDDTFLQLRPDAEQDLPRAHILPLAPRNVMEPFVNTNVFSSTLPRGRVYAAPETCLQYEQPQEEAKPSPDRGLTCASKTSTLLSGSSGSSKLYSSPQIPLRASRSWDELSTGHVYEEPQRTRPGSVDEGLSDLSDVTGDYTSDLFYSDAGSPVLLRPSRRSRRRHHTACYINAKQFAAQQPISIQPPRNPPAPTRDSLTPPHRAPHQASPHQLAAHRGLQPPSPASHPPPPPHYTTHRAAIHPPAAHATASRHPAAAGVTSSKSKGHTDVY